MRQLFSPAWRWAKLFTMIIVIIPVLIFLAFLGAVSLIDFNQYKPQFEKEVSQRIGYELKIAGAIEVSVFPFSFSAGDVTLKNSASVVERFQRDDLLSVKKVRAELSIWSLLVKQQLSINSLELIEPNLTLLRDEQGHNWERLQRFAAYGEPLIEGGQRRSAVANAEDLERFKQGFKLVNQGVADLNEADVQTKIARSSEAESYGWHFDSLIIKQGAFEHQDRRVQRSGKVTDLNLLALDVTLGKPFQVRSDYQYEDTQNDRRYRFDVSANLDVSQNFTTLKVTNWQGIFNLLLPEDQKVPAMRLVTEGKLFMLDFQNELVEIEGVEMSSLGSKLTGDFKGDYGIDTLFQGSVNVTDVDLRKWFYHLGFPLPGFENDKALSLLNGTFNWQLAANRWAFNDLNLKVDETTFKGNIWQDEQAKTKESSAAYLFDLSVDQLDLNLYLANIDDGFFPLLQAFRSGEPTAEEAEVFTKEVEEIDLDVETSRPADNGSAQASYLPLGIPVSTLRALNANGQIKIGSITLDEVTMEQVEIDLSAKRGEIQLAPFDAQLFKGTLASKFELNVNGETPAYNWYGQLDKVALGAFLSGGWQTKPLDGTLNTHFKFNTRGSNMKLLIQNLQGDLNASSPKGYFYGVNLEKLLSGQRVTAKDRTAYQNLVLKGSIDQGIYKAQQFSVESNGFSGMGFGSLDFNKATLTSQLKLRVHAPPAGLKHLKGVLVPVSYRGPIDRLEWSVDLQALLKDPGNQQRAVKQLQALIEGA